MIDFAFIDSGTGGLPYLFHLNEVTKEYSCIYAGDTKNFPYGEKTHEQIVDNVISLVKTIIEKYDPLIFVVACNTMSVNTLDVLREIFPDKKFVGTVPAIKVAGEISKKRKIGLLATTATINSQYNIDLKNHYAKDCKLVLRADPELISFIEKKSFTASQEECMKACEPAVNFFKNEDCDVIVLGCTHFLNVSEQMQEVAGNNIKVVDSKEGVVNRAIALRKEINLPSEHKLEKNKLFVTGFNNSEDENQYKFISEHFDVDFCGIL